jgi:hypothetical protein
MRPRTSAIIGPRNSLCSCSSCVSAATCFLSASSCASSSCELATDGASGDFHSVIFVRSDRGEPMRMVAATSFRLNRLWLLRALRTLAVSVKSRIRMDSSSDAALPGCSTSLTRFQPYSMLETPPASGSLLCRAAQ